MTKLLLKLFVKNDASDTSKRTAYGSLSGFVGIACNALLFLIKLIAGILSGGISIVSDAFNNLFDMASSIITMIGFKIASKPADKEHPFGHGRMEYMSGFVVAAIIIVVGIELLKSSIDGIMHPTEVNYSVVVFLILLVSITVKLWLFMFNRKLSKDIASGAIAATAQDSINDAVSTAAVLICAIISKFTALNLDAYMGLAVSAFIIISGIKFAAEMINPLLGETPSQEFVDSLISNIMKHDMFCGTHDLIIHSYGPNRCFATVHVEVPIDIDIIKCHELIDECEREIMESMGVLLVIHMDPIDTGDEAKRILAIVNQVVYDINCELSVHDFRIVPGENRTNLIFDVVVPYSVKLSKDKLNNMIQQGVNEIDSSYFCIIQFDRVFN